MNTAELEDRCRELESELAYRESELFEARRQVAALTAERDAARAAADPDLSDYYEPAIIVTDLQAENAALRAQLAKQWTPVTQDDDLSDICTDPRVGIWPQEDGKISMSTRDVEIFGRFSDKYRVCRRTQPAEVQP